MSSYIRTIGSIIVITVAFFMVRYAIRIEGINTEGTLNKDESMIIKDQDYNFDGYNDTYIIKLNDNNKYEYNLYLYDPVNKKLEYSLELSSLRYLTVDTENNYLIEDVSYYTDKGEHIDGLYNNYKWVNGHLVQID
jgi:hypothetical protein